MPDGPAAVGEDRFDRRRRRHRRRVIVHDDSMRPLFRPGDRLYLDTEPGRPVRVGDVVALRDPEMAGRLLLKRIVAVAEAAGPGSPKCPPGTVWVEGDNPASSRDSRQFGAVPSEHIVGVAWFRYAPTDRRGPLTPRYR